jgi:hypothetical protein
VNLQPSVGMDESQFSELVHKEIDSASRGFHSSAKVSGEIVAIAVSGLPSLPYCAKGNNAPGQTFLCGVKQLVHQI